MNKSEAVKKLKLTKDQQLAFNRLKRALKDFEKSGGILIGNNEDQYAVNGVNVIGHESQYDSIPKENWFELIYVCDQKITINDPYNDASPYVIVRE